MRNVLARANSNTAGGASLAQYQLYQLHLAASQGHRVAQTGAGLGGDTGDFLAVWLLCRGSK
jgi:hypothetical protein